MYQCTVCDRTYSRRDAMLRHKRSHICDINESNQFSETQTERSESTSSTTYPAMLPDIPQAKKQDSFFFKHPFTSIVSGPTSCGKTTFVRNLLKMNYVYIQPYIQRIIWMYKRWQPLYDDILRIVRPKVEFVQGLPENIESDDFVQPNIRNLVVIDDLQQHVTRTVVFLEFLQREAIIAICRSLC